MIYDKPRDINLRVFPSLHSLVPKKKRRTSVNEENIIKKAETKKPIYRNPAKPQVTPRYAPQVKAPPIPAKRPEVSSDFENEPIIDITTMPIIDGIPMLRLPDESNINNVPKVKTDIKKTEHRPKEETINIDTLPDIDGVPILDLPKKPITPPIIEKPAATPPKPKKAKAAVSQKATKDKPTKHKKLKNKAHIIKAASFFMMLYASAVISFIIPLRPTYSETEKRTLEKFPEISVEALASGEYFSDISTWFSDTFPYREMLTKANTSIKQFYGFKTVDIHGDVEQGDEIPDAPMENTTTAQSSDIQQNIPQSTQPTPTTDATDPMPDIKTQSLGAIVVAGDAGYEYYSFSNDLAPRFINSVSNIKGAANVKGDVYAMLIPTSIDITLNDSLRAQINSADQKKALNYFNSSFQNVTAVDGIYDAQRLHRKEYTYFRTDHHWTALGAYYAYEQFALEKGITPIPLEQYETKTFDNFLGTFYSGSGQTAKMAENPDTVTAYLPYNDVSCHIVEADGDEFYWNVITDVTNHDRGSKYLTFIGGDNAITTITNKDNPNGETCVVIKESYGNAFVPFLIPHYSTVYVIDPRHYSGTLSEFTQDKNIDDVIFVANISTTRNYVYIDAMERVIK